MKKEKKRKRVLEKTRTGKRRRIPPLSTAILVRLWPDELDELDAWIDQQGSPKITRPEALRRRAGFEAKRVVGAGKDRPYTKKIA